MPLIFLGLCVTHDSDALAQPAFFRDQVEEVAMLRMRAVDLMGFAKPTYRSTIAIPARAMMRSSVCCRHVC